MDDFDKEGFPKIKLREDYFEIKDVDFWEYRRFKYSDVVKINFAKNLDWTFGLLLVLMFTEPYKLKIFTENTSWSYKTSRKFDKDFVFVIKEIARRSKIKAEIIE